MGCPISKSYSKRHCINKNIEYEPNGNNGKEIKIETVATQYRMNEVIREPKVLLKYDVKQLIGNGSFSNVFRVDSKSSKYPYAIKVIGLRSLKDREIFQAEKLVLMTVKHPNIVKFEEVITTKFCAFIVMELATGGDLFERIHTLGHIEEKEAVRISRMLIDAIHYLHGKNITHRDLKPENVLFYCPGDQSRVILTDFGLASYRTSDAKMLSTYCGTLQYLSPEIVCGENYTNKVDIWSLGVIIYFMLGGYLPFVSNDVVQLNEQITKTPHTFKKEIWKTISSEAKDFLDRTLVKFPVHRFDSFSATQHKWLFKDEKKNSHKDINMSRAYKASSCTMSNYGIRALKTQKLLHAPVSYRVNEEQNSEEVQCSSIKNCINQSFDGHVTSDSSSSACSFYKKPFHDLIIKFNPSKNLISKNEILSTRSSSSETQSNVATEGTNSIMSNCSHNMKIEESLYNLRTSNIDDNHRKQNDCYNIKNASRKSAHINLPPLNQKSDRRLSYQGDVNFYNRFQGNHDVSVNRYRNGKCNIELFSTQFNNTKKTHLQNSSSWISSKKKKEFPFVTQKLTQQNNKRHMSDEFSSPKNIRLKKKTDRTKCCYSL